MLAATYQLEGLRLADGGLVLKIEYADAVVQVRLRGLGAVPRGRRDRDPPPVRVSDPDDGAANAGLLERGRPAGPSVREGSGGAEDRALVKVMDGLRAEKTARQMAVDIYGKAAVGAEWYPDGWMRSQIRRWIPKAQALADGGWRDLVPRYVTEE